MIPDPLTYPINCASALVTKRCSCCRLATVQCTNSRLKCHVTVSAAVKSTALESAVACIYTLHCRPTASASNHYSTTYACRLATVVGKVDT